MELRLQGSDEVQFIDFVYQPIRNDEGHVTGIFVGGYEVTEPIELRRRCAPAKLVFAN